ncbi:MAG: carboxypeptidase regulatory-like domain-containing protein [Nitrospirae bacterium]|nr:carboxypeptidase regulatory-like domain-containing protein [Nitrospirota bacterium]
MSWWALAASCGHPGRGLWTRARGTVLAPALAASCGHPGRGLWTRARGTVLAPALILLLLPLAITACGKLKKEDLKRVGISGRVVDGSQDTPLRQATVKLYKPGDTQDPLDETQSGEDGKFSFATAFPGEYEIVASVQGYAPATTTVVVNPGEASEVTVRLYLTSDKFPEWSSYMTRKLARAFLSANGEFWIGTEGGLLRYPSNGSPIAYTTSEGLPSSVVLSLAATDKHILIGTDSGLARFNIKTEEWDVLTKEKDGLPGNRINGIGIDPKDKRLWVVTDGGAGRLEGHYWTTYHAGTSAGTACSSNGLPDNDVRSFVFDVDGRAWFGTAKGVGVFSNNAWCWYSKGNADSGLLDPSVNGMAMTAAGVDGKTWKWFGTDRGISTTDGCKWVSYSSFEPASVEWPPVGESRCTMAEQLCDTSTLTFGCTVDGSACFDDPAPCIEKGGYCRASCPLPAPSCELSASKCNAPPANCTKPAKVCDKTGLACTSDDSTCKPAGGKCVDQPVKCEAIATGCSLPERSCLQGGAACGALEGQCVTPGVMCTIPDRGCGLAATSCTGSNGCRVPARECKYAAARPCAQVYLKVDEAKMPTAAALSIYLPSSNEAWVGTPAGLVRYSQGTWGHEIINVPLGKVSGVGSDGTSIIVGHETGLRAYTGTEWKDYPAPGGPISSLIRDVLLDADGAVWVATDKGVSRFKAGEWKHFRKAEGLPDDDVRSLTLDSEGKLWAATKIGLVKLEGEKFAGLPDTLVDEDVRKLAGDGNGGLWVGTSKGLVYLQKTQVKRMGRSEGLLGEIVTSLFRDGSGALWVATGPAYDPACLCFNGGGVNRIESGKISAAQGLKAGLVNDLGVDSRGLLWAATSQGLSLFDGVNWRSILPNSADKTAGPLSASVTALAFEPSGKAWVGTDKGLSSTDDPSGKWTHFATKDGLGDVRVTALAVREKEIWIGTKNGLSVYRPQ